MAHGLVDGRLRRPGEHRNADAYQPFVMQSLPGNAKPDNKKDNVACPVPSLLLARPPPQVFVYFQSSTAGKVTSPQVPTGALRDRAVPAVVTTEEVASADLVLRNSGCTQSPISLPTCSLRI